MLAVLRGTAELADCAARVGAIVVSYTAPDRAIIDAGSKTLSNDPLTSVFPTTYTGFGLVNGLPGWTLHALSEEHGWLQWEGRRAPTSLVVGQQVQILPNHICPVFHALGECLLVERGEYAATWRGIPRGSGRSLYSPRGCRHRRSGELGCQPSHRTEPAGGRSAYLCESA